MLKPVNICIILLILQNSLSELVDFELVCYVCNTIDHGDSCLIMFENSTSHMHSCKKEDRYCMIKRYAHTSTLENATLDSYQTWSLERNCTNKCENLCLIMGDRFKLQTCTTCCSEGLCNYGKGSSTWNSSQGIDILLKAVLCALWILINFEVS